MWQLVLACSKPVHIEKIILKIKAYFIEKN